MSPNGTTDTLDALEIFADLDPAERIKLAAGFETLAITRGEVLVRQGEEADALYIVITGRFAVTVQGRSAPITEIGPGQPIGEIAFLAGGPRTATVHALRDGLALRLGRSEFDALSAACPAIWRSIATTLARRLADVNTARPAPPDPRPRTLVIIRAGQEPVSAKFIQTLTSVFRDHSRTRIIDGAVARRALGKDAPFDSSDATRTFNVLEARHDFVIYIADPELTAWSDKAIRQADLVLAVGRHSAQATPNALEHRAGKLLSPDAQRLILVHEHHQPIEGTARWLEARTCAMHHHVALDTRADFERLYRFINGSALGLVCCGGGALCPAHVGAYKALTEAGLVFDIMGGASAGSAFTAAFAMGRTPDEIDQETHDIFVTNKAMRRYTLPRYSLLDHTHFDRQLAAHYGGIDIEDLWIPYFAVSSNLSSYDLHRHRTGSLWCAIRASAAIPVVLPPFYTADGQMLVDGGLLDNVPIKVMHELKSGPNVVISFDVPDLERFEVKYADLPSRGDLLRSLANPLRRQPLPAAPHLGTVLLRSLMANRQDFKRHMQTNDLHVIPPLPADIGFMDWHRHTELYRSAHAWMVGELQRLQATGHAALHKPAPSR